MKEQIIFSWSGGKDSALALEHIKRNEQFSVLALLTTVSETNGDVTLQHIPQSFVYSQAKSLGYPIELVSIPDNCSEQEYEKRMRQVLQKYIEKNITGTAFGDLCLNWIRHYREERLQHIGMKALFPLWGKDTQKLSQAFITSGYRAIVTSIDTQKLDDCFLGREYDSQLLQDLPDDIDPCGENGEFHTFVYDGPIFKHPIPFKLNTSFRHSGPFYYLDLQE